jgi:hypothetical protein
LFGNAYILRKDDFIFYLQKHHNFTELIKNGILYNDFVPICDRLSKIQFIIRSWGGHIWCVNYKNVQEVHEMNKNVIREKQTMSKLKSALLLSVALSPIFVSATRGIEVVHAEVVQNAVAQQVQKVAEAKPVKATDKKSNTVAATKTDDSVTTDSNKADSDVKKSDIIAFDDKNFQQKFKETNYYKQQAAMYGENKPGSDANLAAQSASYIATIIGEEFITSTSKPAIMRALGFAGPIGALLGCLVDWLTPAGRDKAEDNFKEINAKLDELGIHLDNLGNAIITAINQKAVDDKIQSFTGALEKTSTPFGTVAGEISSYQSGHQITLASKNPVHVQFFVNKYAELYHTSKWGFNDKTQNAEEVQDSYNFKAFNDLCDLGKAIVSGNVDQNNIFRVMSNYESLKEFFNTQTFATREAFAEYVMSHYTAWASDMMTAIFFDYFRIKGQMDQITASDEYKESVTAAKTNGTTIDDEFQKRCPVSFTLFDGLRANARDDLMRLGYDVKGDKGHNDAYDLDEYDKNNWVDKYDNKSVYMDVKRTNILGANVNAVNHAYATEIENKPVKTGIKIPDYEAKLAAAQEKYEKALAAANRSDGASSYVRAYEEAKAELDKLKATGGYEYEDKVLKDEKGNPMQSKLQTEEKTSNDGKMLYSYRNNKWVYSKLVSGPAAYAAKHMVEKNKTDLDDVKNKSIGYKGGGSTAVDYFDICWTHNTDLPANPSWNAVFEKALTSDDLLCLNTASATQNKIGINSLLSNTVTHVVTGVTQLGFSEIGKTGRIIGDGDYQLAIDPAGTWYTPGYTIGLGYYQNNKHTSPSVDQKTVYQNFKYVGTYKDSKTNEYVQDYHDKHYDQEDVTFIRGVKDGDSELGALNNGNKIPVAPEHFVE